MLEAHPLHDVGELDIDAEIVGIELELIALEQAAVLVDIHEQASRRRRHRRRANGDSATGRSGNRCAWSSGLSPWPSISTIMLKAAVASCKHAKKCITRPSRPQKFVITCILMQELGRAGAGFFWIACAPGSWRVPAGGRPVRVSRGGRPVAEKGGGLPRLILQRVFQGFVGEIRVIHRLEADLVVECPILQRYRPVRSEAAGYALNLLLDRVLAGASCTPAGYLRAGVAPPACAIGG